MTKVIIPHQSNALGTARAGRMAKILVHCSKSLQFTVYMDSPASQVVFVQGITSDDVIYLVMIDRFADGDTSNDNPPNTSASANDRNNPRAWHGGDFRGLINHLE